MEEMVKIKDVKTGVEKSVKKSLAGDYIGTKRFEMATSQENKIKYDAFSKEEKEHDKN